MVVHACVCLMEAAVDVSKNIRVQHDMSKVLCSMLNLFMMRFLTQSVANSSTAQP